MAPEPDILDSLPHRPPFRFLTSLTSLDRGREARGQWKITGDEDFFAGHFPGRPIVPGVLIAEALAQLAGLAGLGDATRGAGGRLAHVDIRFDRAVAPPARIALEATLVRMLGSLSQYDVRASVGGAIVARGSLTLATVGDDRSTP